MNEYALFATAALAHALAVMSPGPDFAMVVRQTLAHGRAAGVRTALGIGSGICVHVAWGLFGLGWLLARMPWLLDALLHAGAGFLIWMGAQALRAQPQTAQDEVASPAAARHRDYLIGVLTNLLNPKAMLFFVALCTPLVTAGASAALRFALGAWIVFATTAWFSLVSVTLDHPRWRATLRRHAHWIDRGMGLVLIALGLAMLISRHLR